MANHKSTKKRIRSNKSKNEGNKLQHKTVRNAIKNTFLESQKDKDKKQPTKEQIVSMIDKLEKRNVIHKNKAGRLKSKLMKKSS